MAQVAEAVVRPASLVRQETPALAGMVRLAQSASGPGRPDVHKLSTTAVIKRLFSYEDRGKRRCSTSA